MALDTVFTILGLAISVGGLIAAGFKKQVVFAIFACALIVTTGTASLLAYMHDRELSQTETEIKKRLDTNQWTLERIRLEMNNPDPKVLVEALSRALRNGTVKDQATQCITNNGSVLSTRVYFN